MRLRVLFFLILALMFALGCHHIVRQQERQEERREERQEERERREHWWHRHHRRRHPRPSPPPQVNPLTPGSPPPLTTYQQPATPNVGNLTGAGTVVNGTVPYSYTVARCTDVNTSTASTISHSFEITDSGNGFDQEWNADGTMLAVINMATGSGTVVVFNRATMQCTAPFTSLNGGSPPFSMPTSRSWDRTDPNAMWGMTCSSGPPSFTPNSCPGTFPTSTPGKTTLTKYIFNRSTGAVTSTNVFDFSTCPGMPASNTIQWTSLGGTAPSGVVEASFSSTGGQDTGILANAWDPVTGGCQSYNTNTGAMTASGGFGVAGTATTNYSFQLHATVVWPSGWVELEDAINSCLTPCPASHGPMFWQMGTLNTTMPTTPGSSLGGHTAGDYTNWINLPNAPQLCKRPFTNPTTCTVITAGSTPGFSAPQNTHLAYQNADPAETQPIIESETGQPSAVYWGGMTVPLQQQLFLVYPTTGYYLPLTFNFTSGYNSNYPTSQVNFRSVQVPPAVDPTGNFVAFASDWMGTLGNWDGVTSTCTLGGGAWAARTSTFVFPVNYQIEPNTSPNNPNKYVFIATVSGTRGTTEPNWNSVAIGSTITDGTVTWQNTGQVPNCRSDVFIAAIPQGPPTNDFSTTGAFKTAGQFQAQ